MQIRSKVCPMGNVECLYCGEVTTTYGKPATCAPCLAIQQGFIARHDAAVAHANRVRKKAHEIYQHRLSTGEIGTAEQDWIAAQKECDDDSMSTAEGAE